MRKELLVNTERYHVYNRGADKIDIFLDDEDRRKFLWNILHYQCDADSKPIVAVSVYALMTNHFHLAIQQLEQDGVSLYMKRVCLSYAMYFNRKYDRSGCLFAGRFKARRIHNDAYFLHLTRYIHRNPIDIVGAARLEDYQWSSYRVYIGLDKSFVITDQLAIEMFSHPSSGYKQFMRAWNPVEDLLIQEMMIDDGE